MIRMRTVVIAIIVAPLRDDDDREDNNDKDEDCQVNYRRSILCMTDAA